jgi:glyoxylase-like metal-dependent hydrolase (beta-lactamase superfamily II)
MDSNRIRFDTGLGASDSALLACLQELGIGPDVIDVVVLAHGHPDHIGGLIEDERTVFARARGRIRFLDEGRWNSRRLPEKPHMPFPELGYVQRAPGSFRWLPISYQLILKN